MARIRPALIACGVVLLGACAVNPVPTPGGEENGSTLSLPDVAETISGGGAEPDVGRSPGPECTPKSATWDCTESGPCERAVCKAGKCLYLPDSGKHGFVCDNGYECDGYKDTCKSGKCVGSMSAEQACWTQNEPCKVAGCTPTGACTVKAKDAGVSCDDGHPCTASTKCDGTGECRGGTFNCGCVSIYDLYDDGPAKKKKLPSWLWDHPDIESKACAKWVNEDNKCMGQLYCDKSAPLWQCKALPGTTRMAGQYACPKSANPCMAAACDPKTGECADKPLGNTKLCDDGDPCTDNDLCDGNGGCKGDIELCACKPGNAKQECGHLIGDNACLGVYCDTSKGAPNFACKLLKSATVKCYTGNDDLCATNKCNPKTGACEMTPTAAKACDDGDACTVSETCFAGACGAPDPVAHKKLLADGDPTNDTQPTGGQGAPVCQCKSNADCAGKEDGNACNGTLYCNPTTGKCRTLDASVVQCATVMDTACRRNVCYPSTGACKLTPEENVAPVNILDAAGKVVSVWSVPHPYPVKPLPPCDDTDPCTGGDHCAAGACTAGKTSLCACNKDSDCVDDGDACNGTPRCRKSDSTCQPNPATVPACPQAADTACRKNRCDSKTGLCAFKALDGAQHGCDDGDPCTTADACNGGSCAGKQAPCPCNKTLDCMGREDGDPCTGTLYCDVAAGRCRPNLATVPRCDPRDDLACLHRRCDPATGTCRLQPRVEGLRCEDGNPCTAGDTCRAGGCMAGKPGCGCAKDADCAGYGATATACSAPVVCDKGAGQCRPAGIVICEDDGAGCFGSACQPKTGKCVPVARAAGHPCDDGSPCTVGDGCDGKGGCKAGTNVCACAKDLDCLAFSDGNKCHAAYACKAGPGGKRCVRAPLNKCAVNPQGGSCQDRCHPPTGKCLPPLNEPYCGDDGNPCTQSKCAIAGLTCSAAAVASGGRPAGVAADGQPLVCSDGKPLRAPAGMRLVPASSFEIGCWPKPVFATGGPAEAAAKAVATACQAATDAQPSHNVAVSAFWIDTFEVTVQRYAGCVKAGSCTPPPAKTPAGCRYPAWLAAASKSSPDAAALARTAMNCVPRAQAAAYCAWWAGQDAKANGVTTAGAGALPTEAQWELAARGGCNTHAIPGSCLQQMRYYPWGNGTYPADCDKARVASTTLACGADVPGPVGVYAADTSVYGVTDTAGNVAEWVRDGYDKGFYATAAAAQKDPYRAPKAGESGVVRGGSHATKGAAALSFVRRQVAPTAAPVDVGFRCVRPAKVGL